MPATVAFTGLACGALLAAIGLAVWGESCQEALTTDAVRATVRVTRWMAGGLLIVGALLACRGQRTCPPPTGHLILMAALAAPPESHRQQVPHWLHALSVLPALGLAAAGLIWAAGMSATGIGTGPITPTELALIIGGGLAARALAAAVGDVTGSISHVEWPTASTYALLTLIVGGTVLASICQRGSAWAGTPGERSLAGAWLGWTAAWLSPRRPLWLRFTLIVVAACLLIALAAGYPALLALG